MSAYNRLNGEWCGEHAGLLTGVLRDEWRFDGFVISDFVFGLRDPVASVAAGLDVEMPFRQQRAVDLPEALASGALPEDVVDRRVEAVVATLLRHAPLVTGDPPPTDVIASPAHRALAREAAVESFVLLRNDGSLLPADPERLRRVAVLGRLAAVANLGDRGSSDVHPPGVVTPLDGLRAALPEAEVRHDDTDATIADGADLVVVVVGTTSADEGEYVDTAGTAALAHLFPPMDHPELGFAPREAPPEGADPAAAGGDEPPDTGFAPGGDRVSLRLAPDDEALVRAAAAASDRVVVAVMGGSAFVLPWLDEVPATLMIWYPGMEGGHALADVVLGRAEPGGRLPFVLPADESQLVDFDRDATTARYGLLHGQWHLDAIGATAARPFGYGLGFADLCLAGAHIDVADDRGAGTAEVEVTNRADRPGATVVQVYAEVPGSQRTRPPRRLVGFAKVRVGAGATVKASIPLRLDLLDVRVDGTWERERAALRLVVGRHAHDQEVVVEV
jgi:beta-glucosidase